MWDFVKITGVTKGNLIEVKFPTGEHVMATLLTSVLAPIPSPQWFLENKDNFLAILATKEGVNPYPVVLGFYPVKGADSEKFSIFGSLLQMYADILDMLSTAMITTSLGPQPFLPDTQAKIVELKTKIEQINLKIGTVQK